MVVSVYNEQDRGNKMSEGNCEELEHPKELTLILALYIYPECFVMKGYQSCEHSLVDDVKAVASTLSKVPKELLVVNFEEVLLKNGTTLKSYGLRSGDTLMITRRMPEKPRKLTESDIKKVCNAFKSYRQDAKSRAVFKRLSEPDFLQKLLDTVPGLDDDLSGYALVTNPHFFIQMGDPVILRRVVEQHPWVAEAAWNFMTILEEERANMPDLPENLNYHTGLSDNDDEDSDSSESPPYRHFDNIGYILKSEHYISVTQLATALAEALCGQSTSSTLPEPPRVVSPHRTSMSHPPSTGHDFVTPEMFNEAVQRAYANVSSRSQEIGQSSSSLGSQPSGPPELPREQLACQLEKLEELGFTDETLNLRVLRITGGDVQGAVDLIFGGFWIDDEPPEVEHETMQESD